MANDDDLDAAVARHVADGRDFNLRPSETGLELVLGSSASLAAARARDSITVSGVISAS